ncbi:MAG: outer membrane protein transport protein [Alphaproteobacteria bacterium]|nr:outer membrane protein transport protein [Alphaproteobacteria bacterium]
MKKILATTVLCATCVWSVSAHASGYQLNEYSITNLGRSFAGAGVVGDDYSAIAYNPAGMTLKKSGAQLSFTVAEVASEMKGQNDKQGKQTEMDFGVPLPSVYGQYQVNDKWFVGAGVYAPYGLATKYKNSSFIADKARESILEVIDYNISAAYKINSKWSLGASFIARYIYGKMTNNLVVAGMPAKSKFDLDGWTYTGTLGLMYEYDENTRFGLSYKPKSVQRVKGDHTISLMTPMGIMNNVYPDGKASPDLPETLLLSAYHKPFEKVAFTGAARFTRWGDSFKEFEMTSTATKGLPAIDYSWEDTWTISAGMEYYVNDNWTLRLGTAWDQSPTPDNQHRTHRIPDSDRIWASAGLSYRYDNMQFDLGYAHLFMKKSHIRDSVNKDYDTKYRAYSNMFGLGFQYDF